LAFYLAFYPDWCQIWLIFLARHICFCRQISSTFGILSSSAILYVWNWLFKF
jgi:hypothetical protein